MSVTWPTSHAATGWLKAYAKLNMDCGAPPHAHAEWVLQWQRTDPEAKHRNPYGSRRGQQRTCMLVTLLTSHALRFSSNEPRHGQGKTKSETALTSHAEIWPYVACAAAPSAHHSSTASSRLALSLNADALPARVRSSPNTSHATLVRCLAAHAEAGTAARLSLPLLRLENVWLLDDSMLALPAPRTTPVKHAAI